jgi:hypothetical protein
LNCILVEPHFSCEVKANRKFQNKTGKLEYKFLTVPTNTKLIKKEVSGHAEYSLVRCDASNWADK